MDPSKENDLEAHLTSFNVPLEVRQRIKTLGFTETYNWPWAVEDEPNLLRCTRGTPIRRRRRGPQQPAGLTS